MSFNREDECESCRQKPGSPLLCASCQIRQTEYSKYHWARKPRGDKVHAFALPLGAGNKTLCNSFGLWREDVCAPRHGHMPKCGNCKKKIDDKIQEKLIHVDLPGPLAKRVMLEAQASGQTLREAIARLVGEALQERDRLKQIYNETLQRLNEPGSGSSK
jgi:hypothetical protein